MKTIEVINIRDALLKREYAEADESVVHLLSTWEPEEENWMPSDVLDLAVNLADAVGLRLDIFAEHLELVRQDRIEEASF